MIRMNRRTAFGTVNRLAAVVNALLLAGSNVLWEYFRQFRIVSYPASRSFVRSVSSRQVRCPKSTSSALRARDWTSAASLNCPKTREAQPSS